MRAHSESSPLKGKIVVVDIGNGPEKARVEDWWDVVSGQMWDLVPFGTNHAANNYAMRVPTMGLPWDQEVLYAKIQRVVPGTKTVAGLGFLVHVSEITEENPE